MLEEYKDGWRDFGGGSTFWCAKNRIAEVGRLRNVWLWQLYPTDISCVDGYEQLRAPFEAFEGTAKTLKQAKLDAEHTLRAHAKAVVRFFERKLVL